MSAASTVSVTETLRPGDVVAGGYRLTASAGDSGWGPVWRAAPRKGSDHVEVVFLEALRPGVSTAQALTRLGELRAVEHRGLAKVVEGAEHAGVPTVIYRGTDGVPLRAWLDERAKGGASAKLAALREVFDQVAQALGAAHRVRGSEPWAHGSFGPACVRVERRGASVVIVRVEGFGLTRIVTAPAWWSPPPEGEAPSPRADVYAVGQALVALTAGSSPPSWEPAPLRAWWERRCPELDASLLAAALSLLDADPARRPKDGHELREALRAASWKAVERPPPPPPPPPREPDPPPPPPPPPRAKVVEVILRAPTHPAVMKAAERVAPVIAPTPPALPEELDETTQVDDAPRAPVVHTADVALVEDPPTLIDTPAPELDESTQVDAPASVAPVAACDEESTAPLGEFAAGTRAAPYDDAATNIPAGAARVSFPRVQVDRPPPTQRVTPITPRIEPTAFVPLPPQRTPAPEPIETTAPMVRSPERFQRPSPPHAEPRAASAWWPVALVIAALFGVAFAWWIAAR